MDVKHILKYLKRMREHMFVSLCTELVFLGYQKLEFQSDEDFHRSTSKYVYTLSSFYCF